MTAAGHRLRALREQLGLTIRDVETASFRLAAKYHNEDFSLPISRISDIETKGLVPSLYRLYSLAVIYRQDFRELLSWYGVDLNQIRVDLKVIEIPRSHMARTFHAVSAVRMPVRLDPGFDLRRTTNLGRMIEKWGIVPLAYLDQFADPGHTYGYIGCEDFTMYPILLPGSFVQIDESRNTIVDKMWRAEYERPIYFVETRDGYTCSWCTLKGEQLIVQPHPLSPAQPRVFKHPQEAEVIGQVVAVAMRLDDWHPHPNGSGKAPKGLKEPN